RGLTLRGPAWGDDPAGAAPRGIDGAGQALPFGDPWGRTRYAGRPTMQKLRRLLVPLLALGALVWVVLWLMSKREVQFRLGPGLELVATDGVEIGRASWR